MGYSTSFEGAMKIEPSLTPDQVEYLKAFSLTRRMKRDVELAGKMVDPRRDKVDLPLGEDAGYFVDAGGMGGQGHTDDIIDYNCPPSGQPSLWCDWEVNDAGDSLEWNGGKKFYGYPEWLEYLVEHFFSIWGSKLNGSIEWTGDDPEDRGVMTMAASVLSVEMLDPVAEDDLGEEEGWDEDVNPITAYGESIKHELMDKLGWKHTEASEFFLSMSLCKPLVGQAELEIKAAVDHILKYKLTFMDAHQFPWLKLKEMDTSLMSMHKLCQVPGCTESYVKEYLKELGKAWDEDGMESIMADILGDGYLEEKLF